MNRNSDVGIYANHLVVDVGMLPHQNFRIPSTRNKDGVDATHQGSRKDIGDLEANQEGEGYDDWCVSSILIVGRSGEGDIEEGQEGASVANEDGPE